MHDSWYIKKYISSISRLLFYFLIFWFAYANHVKMCFEKLLDRGGNEPVTFGTFGLLDYSALPTKLRSQFNAGLYA